MKLTSNNECLHCGTVIPRFMQETSFCCHGCQLVYKLIQEGALEQYYELKDKKTTPLIGLFSKQTDLSWVPTYLLNKPQRSTFQLQGVQCAACVWLIQELAKKHPSLRVSINTGQGLMAVTYGDDHQSVMAFLEQLQQFGYIPSQPQDVKTSSTRGLLIRLGISAGLSMNVMMFSASFYTGLTLLEQPELHRLFGWLGGILASLVVWIGGGYFFQKAWKSLRQGILHYDLPISLGIVLAYTGSLITFFTKNTDNTYFDSVCVFITLMLLGRFIQERMLEKNKQGMLHQATLLEHTVRIVHTDGKIQQQPLHAITQNQHLVLPVGSLIPVDCLMLEPVDIELDVSWITGEPEPQMHLASQKIPAGAILLGPQAIEVRAQNSFQDSDLDHLLSQVQYEETLPKRWQMVSRYYVWGVLALCAFGFGLWSYLDHWSQGLSVAVAIAVVTCPCSLGISIPLARTLAYRILMRHGVLIQKPYTLDRLAKIDHVAFDKTGTVTLSRLIWTNPDVSQALPLQQQSLLLSATTRSHHPASRAIYQELATQNITPLPITVTEVAGQGLHFTYKGDAYFLGRALISDSPDPQRSYEALFYKNKELLARFALQEVLQDHMEAVVAWLKQQKKQVWLISGDKQTRINSMAKHLGIKAHHAIGDALPTEKREALTRMTGKTLFIGDGINDQLALETADVSGLSMHSQLQLSQRASFYFLSESMTWLPTVLSVAKTLQRTTRANLTFLLGYNSLVITLALLGLITPLISAIIMPISSIWVIARTSHRMSKADINHVLL